MASSLKDNVRSYWEDDPCGAKTAISPYGTPAFFAEVEAERDRLEPYIHEFAAFDRWRDKDVLEVGVGLGTDFVRFARAGARAVGVDLTEAAAAAVRARLDLEGLAG